MTDWSEVARAADPDSHGYEASRTSLAQRYWPIIYAFIRQSGRDEETALDLTQGFLADVLFSRGLLDRANPERGRFRTLLLSSVVNYLRDDHRRRTAARRHPGEGRFVLHGALPVIRDPSLTPEQAFAAAWVAMLIREAAEQCRQQCMREEREAAWICLERRILRPALEGASPATTEELKQITGLATASRIARALASAKRCFAERLLERIGASAHDDASDEEIRTLLKLLDGEKGRSSS
ncbi:MAG: hypothetical protein KF724_03170 [Phycisphaeraceae bacterium]|nr:hypothetical protein [Phycisphaeraceae bacterium]